MPSSLWSHGLQASLSFTISCSLLKLMSIESMMPSNHIILSCALLLMPSIFPSIRVFSSELTASGGQSIGALASASVFPMNIQDWFPLGLTSLISLQSKGLSGVFSRPIPVRNHILKSSLVVQWLRLCPSSTGGAGLIPGWRTKIPHAVLWGQKKKKIKESHFVARTKELTTESQTN